MFVLLLCCIVLGGCGSTNESGENTPPDNSREIIESEQKEDEAEESLSEIEGFRNVGMEYDKFNSPASQNGLGGTLIFVEGKVISQEIVEDPSVSLLAITMEQTDGNKWLVSLESESNIEEIDDKNIRVFGTYQGFSNLMNLPAMAVAAEDIHAMDKARLEVEEDGEYVVIWSFLDHLNSIIEKEAGKTVSDLYGKEELVVENLSAIEFKIPQIFLEDTKEIGEWKYFYYEDLMLGICCSETRMTNEELLENVDQYVDSVIMNADNGKLIDNSLVSVSVAEAIKIKMQQDISGAEYEVNMISFCYDSRFYTLDFVAKKDSEFDYAKDFDKLVESIRANGIDADNSNQEEGEKEGKSGNNEKTDQVDEPKQTEKDTATTTGERNALSSAKRYLSTMAFSHDGLIEQLEYEKYSNQEATYAADNCGADWNEQALKSAKNYLSMMAFSYTGLIEQLEYEKFTAEQATYGADNCGANWNEQAAKSAENYLSMMSFSRDELIEQLEYEGFTHEQAIYGAEQNGY